MLNKCSKSFTLIIWEVNGIFPLPSAAKLTPIRDQALYPEDYSAALTHDQYVGEARERWKQSRAAFRDSLKTQAGIMASLQEDEQLWQQLARASQSSEGAMQVGQVTNQILALRAQQEARSQQLMAMHIVQLHSN